MKDEPGAHADAIAPALRRLTEAIGIPPRKMTETAAKPKRRGERKWFGEAVRSAEAVSLWGGPARTACAGHDYRYGHQASIEELSARFNLRYWLTILGRELAAAARGSR